MLLKGDSIILDEGSLSLWPTGGGVVGFGVSSTGLLLDDWAIFGVEVGEGSYLILLLIGVERRVDFGSWSTSFCVVEVEVSSITTFIVSMTLLVLLLKTL